MQDARSTTCLRVRVPLLLLPRRGARSGYLAGKFVAAQVYFNIHFRVLFMPFLIFFLDK